MSNMMIDVRRLWDKTLWTNSSDNYNYSTLCEGYVAEVIARRKQWTIDAITQGQDDRYDLMMSGKLIEVKVSSGYVLKLEYRRENGKPSGISTSKADYYAMLNASRNGVGKLRLIPRAQLLELVYKKLEDGVFKFAGGANGEQGYYYVPVNPYDEMYNNDGWLCDVPYTSTDTGTGVSVVYDLGEAPREWGHSVTARLHKELTFR